MVYIRARSYVPKSYDNFAASTFFLAEWIIEKLKTKRLQYRTKMCSYWEAPKCVLCEFLFSLDFHETLESFFFINFFVFFIRRRLFLQICLSVELRIWNKWPKWFSCKKRSSCLIANWYNFEKLQYSRIKRLSLHYSSQLNYVG